MAAVLLTCFNRKEKTLSCLESIYAQSNKEGFTLKVYLVDDGSKDGTSAAIANTFPDVCILSGNGTLYWNGGMNMAWRAAIKEGHDCYIWINDDVSLSSDALHLLFESYKSGYTERGTEPVVVGCFRDPISYNHTYGGFSIKKSIWGISTKRLHPENRILRCDTFNGNLVLIPDSVVKIIGILDEHYTHAFGDKDYGYRCMENDIPMYITPGYVGECTRNSVEGRWLDSEASLRERYRRLKHPTGHPPKEYFYFYKKHSNYFAGSVALLKLYLRLVFPGMWSIISKKEDGE